MTRGETIAKLGKPNSVATLADGREHLAMAHSKAAMFGAKLHSVALVFASNGKLDRTVQPQTNIK